MAELSPEQKTALRRTLVDLFPTRRGSEVLVSDAGIRSERIEFSQQAENNWFAIIQEAERQEKLPALVSTASAAYPNNSQLKELVAVLERPSAISKPTESPDPASDASDIPSRLQQVKKLILLDDDLSRVLEQMLALTLEVDSLKRMENDVIALTGRWNSLKRQGDQGVLPGHERERQTNVLRQAILGTLERMEE